MHLTPWQGILFGLMVTVVGIGLLIFSVASIKSYNQKNETYTEISAEVVEYDYDSDNSVAIIVEYTVDGQKYKKQSDSYSNNPTPFGDEVKIKYNPDDPSDAIFVNDNTNILMLFAGGVFAIVGIVTAIKSAKSRKEEASLTQQPNELGNSDNVANTLQNSFNTELNSQTQTSAQPVNQPQQVTQYGQPVKEQSFNQSQSTLTQNINYSNSQNQTDNNQNNINSNL